MWIILGIVTIGLLAYHWNSHGSVWGGFTAGLIVGIIVAIYFSLTGSSFDWSVVGKGIIIGTLLGFGADLLGKISDKNRPVDSE